MKNLFRIMSVLLVFTMLFSFVACAPAGNGTETQGSNNTENTPGGSEADPNKYADIAGEYLLDASNLGMPMKWFIKISADGKFVISTARDYATVKGEGTVGDKDGTYMFMYSDSTQEAPKTATFKFEGKNIVFSTSVPIGAASVSPNEEEKKYPVAKIMACEDILGTYLGTYEKVSAMAGNVLYSYELVLGYGLEYTFASSFAMMGNTYTRTETGSFAVNDKEISFTAATVDGEAVADAATVKGSIQDKTIKAAFKLSAMASEAQEIEAKLGVYAQYAGTYAGLYEKQMGPTMKLSYGTALILDAFGGYSYATASTTDPSKTDYSEVGTYTVTDGKFSFKSNKEGAVAVEGTLVNYVLTAKFPISAMMTTPVDVSFYAEEVSGSFYAETEDGGKTYAAQMVLAGNQFVLAVGEKDATNPAYIAVGTFEIKAGMMTTVTLTTSAAYTDVNMQTPVSTIPAEIKTVSAPVAESGINAELLFDLDDAKVIGFQFAKAAM